MTNFPIHSATQPVCGCFTSLAADAFVAVITADPTASAASNLVFSTFLGGTGSDIAMGVTVEGSVAFVAGYTDSPGNKKSDAFPHALPFPTTAGALQPRRAGATDAFVAAFDGV